MEGKLFPLLWVNLGIVTQHSQCSGRYSMYWIFQQFNRLCCTLNFCWMPLLPSPSHVPGNWNEYPVVIWCQYTLRCNIFLCYQRHCLDIRDYLATAVIYETVGDWPQVNIHINPPSLILIFLACYFHSLLAT